MEHILTFNNRKMPLETIRCVINNNKSSFENTIIKTIEEVIQRLANIGYDDIKVLPNNRITVYTKTGDRIGVLVDIAKELKGKYKERKRIR